MKSWKRCVEEEDKSGGSRGCTCEVLRGVRMVVVYACSHRFNEQSPKCCQKNCLFTRANINDGGSVLTFNNTV